MTGRTRYGDLLRDAAGQIAAANVAIQRERFTDRDAANDAASAYRDLLHALNRHGWQLFGSDTRAAGLRACGNPAPREIAAMRLVDELAAVGRRAQSDGRRPVSAAAADWVAAASSVRTASDLLATHRETDGAWRSPQAQILDDPAVRAVGFAELAALVVPTAEAATHLGLRAGKAGALVTAWHWPIVKSIHRAYGQTTASTRSDTPLRGGSQVTQRTEPRGGS